MVNLPSVSCCRRNAQRHASGRLSNFRIYVDYHGPDDLGWQYVVGDGNSCLGRLLIYVSYPVFLRLIIWTIHRLLPDTPNLREYRMTLRFLLDHPRRCYTNLFPSTHTWWLLGTILLLNSIDWGAFELLNVCQTSSHHKFRRRVGPTLKSCRLETPQCRPFHAGRVFSMVFSKL